MNDRSGLGFVERGRLGRLIAEFFDRPDERVIGAETAAEALQRFEQAVRSIAAEAPEETIAIVTHGTVLTLLIAKHNRVSPWTFWASLGLPSCVLIDASSFRLEGTPATASR
ncbi:MAG: histidine phosphatase family protein [Caulobacteraceae bacterium]